ncbi:alpha,alpha-trehalose-phosphate synthase [candidate division MSBL1 archaeon SCGC-AAA259O05]|uniref:Alpha,alpha-trehalose-phosphate synthase n=1 Tax=candidate division MSBL1 archaeon SCGC-AAA259O05 TaxID=1698271 RepID=A0A133V4K0_9EURY|nr:alpha,alpha-trehalose-phosphate synthase [candidate division MSBL1 archaeon SCGC-AAA259O05]
MNFQDRRLILVSNAEPYIHKWEGDEIVSEKLAGGLTTALDPLIKKIGGTWIAWGRGDADFEVLDSEGKVEIVEDGTSYELKRIRLSEEEVDGFYLDFSNELLWPIFHSFPEKSTLEDYRSSEEKWKIYRDVNRKYADAVTEEFEEGDLVWIHDYHLTLVPKMIREEYPTANIAFFWHIPWPSWEIFGNLPWREEIVGGLLNSDFLGFHTSPLKDNFLSCIEKTSKKVNYEDSTVKTNRGATKVSAIPLGVDYDRFSSFSAEESLQEEAKKIKRSIPADKIILGVDRLDYTKGIPQRLRAFELFLEEYPEFQGEITLVQRIPPSRISAEEYKSILKKINRIIGEINGRFEKTEWTPIKSFHRFLPEQKQLIPYYLASDIALVTPLIDGMNLISKEWIASSDDGVLILSEFTGAAEDLKEAIQVNPYNTREMAEGIEKALRMDETERRNRLEKLKRRVRENDLKWWREEFMNSWLGEDW